MAAITPNPPAPRDPDRDAATIMRLRKEVADLKAAALTPPEGYRLVPVEPTDEEVRVANEAQQDFFDANLASRFFSSGHYGEESIRHSLRAVRAARPEVDR